MEHAPGMFKIVFPDSRRHILFIGQKKKKKTLLIHSLVFFLLVLSLFPSPSLPQKQSLKYDR